MANQEITCSTAEEGAMGTYDKLDKVVGLDSLQQAIAEGVDEDLFALISSLIVQNAELMQKLQELTSEKELSDETMAEVRQKANVLSLLAEKEVNRRVDNIISDAKEKAKAEADRIIAEATRQADAIGTHKEKQVDDSATSIIREAETRAKIEADKILSEAKRKAEEIVEEKTQFAIQQGLLIINKAEEVAISILKDVQNRSNQLLARSNHKGRG
jgi:vacuolar-type H+-ATPase subunit H